MKTVNVQEAKTHLSRLLEAVAGGETIVIAKAGTPIASLTKWQPAIKERVGGGWKGKVWVSPDFDEPDPELEKLFYDPESNAEDVALFAENPPNTEASGEK